MTDREAVGLSANVLLLGLLFCGLGFGLGTGALAGSGAAFSFVMAGWVLGLCLHAFGHALAARHWGLPGTGALTLDPRRMADPLATLVLPVVLTVLSGLGFPAGIARTEAAGADRTRRSATAAAGPAASLAFLLVLAGLYALARPEAETLRAALAVSVLFQATGLILGLAPVPGLDGYDILRPWLSGAWAWTWTDRMARQSSLVLVGLFLVSGAFSRPVFGASLRLTAAIGIDLSDVIAGYRLIRLW